MIRLGDDRSATLRPAAIAGPINYVGSRTGVITRVHGFPFTRQGFGGPLPFLEREQGV